MDLKPGYKRTEVGIVPEEWEMSRLRQLSQFVTSGSRGWARFYSDAGPLFVQSQNIRDGRLDLSERQCVVPPAGSEGSRTRLNRCDLLITMTGNSVGNVGWVNEDIGEAYISQHVGLVRLTDASLAEYVCRFLAPSSPGNRQIWASQTGQSKPGLNLRNLEDFWIALPSCLERRAVTTTLSDVDALLSGLDHLIAKKRDLKQAATQQLLTGQTHLPGFSEEWETKRVGEVADVLKGSTLSRSHVARSGNRRCILYGELFTTYNRVIRCVVGRTHSIHGLPSRFGDVLMPGSTTTTGADLAVASALLVDEVALGGDILVIRQKANEYDPAFLANYLTYVRRQQITELTQGITIHHLYGKELKTLSLDLPSKNEQTAIAAVLADMDAEIAALDDRREKTRALKQAIMHELLTGRTRLVPADQTL